MKGKITAGFLLVVAMAVLCACHVDFTKQNKDQKSVPALRTEKPEEPEKQDLLWEQYYNTTEQCVYDYDYSWSEGGIIQRDWQGKVLSRHKVEQQEEAGDLLFLLGVSEEHICYAVGDDGSYGIYAVPLEQEDGTERVLWGQEEKIARTNEAAAYISEPYLFYTKGHCLLRFRFDTGKSELILKGKQDIFIHQDIFIYRERPVVSDGMLYVGEGKENEDGEIDYSSFYLVDIRNGEAEQLYTVEKGYSLALLEADGALLYMMKENQRDGSWDIECFDSGTQETKSILKEKQLHKFLKTEKLLRPKEYLAFARLTEVFPSEDRIYFLFEIYYEYILKNKYTNVDTSVVISCPRGEVADLSNEAVLNEWLYGHTDEDWRKEGFSLYGDEICFYYGKYKEEGTARMMSYHIKDKVLREVQKTEPMYQQFAVLLSDVEALHPDDE